MYEAVLVNLTKYFQGSLNINYSLIFENKDILENFNKNRLAMVAGFVDAPQYINTTPSKLDSHSRLMIVDLASVSDWNGALR